MSLPFDLDGVRKSPSMYLFPVEFDVIIAYVLGIDAATHFSFLLGFQEWLVLKWGQGPDLAWPEIILKLAFAGVPNARSQLEEANNHAKAIDCFFSNFQAFWEERSTRNGMLAIFLRYHAWLKRQEWYTPTDPDWIDDEGNRQPE